MLARYCGPGLLGLGITALIAGFMSGMAGNVSAFTTVWTYDIYRNLMYSKGSDAHYVLMGRWSTIIGVVISIGTALLVTTAAGIMDYVQALFSFFIAPLFGTVILGMLWKRATPYGGFGGLLAGTLASIAMFVWVLFDKPHALSILCFSSNASDLAADMYRALWSFLVVILVTVLVSLMTTAQSDASLKGLVMGCTEMPKENYPILERPVFWAIVVGVLTIVINIIFW
jgi:SSS family solute:Na+ symporter